MENLKLGPKFLYLMVKKIHQIFLFRICVIYYWKFERLTIYVMENVLFLNKSEFCQKLVGASPAPTCIAWHQTLKKTPMS